MRARRENKAQQIIAHLGLEPLPGEGGLFRETYRAKERIAHRALPSRYNSARSFSTAIYYLLTSDPGSFSSLHRVKSDETFHFYLGDPVEMLLLHPHGESERIVLGQNILRGQRVQFTVARGIWQGSRLISGGKFALLGTTVAPGFDYADYEQGERGKLLRLYPKQAQLIRRLTKSSGYLP
jgi:uncharacterized protein